MIPNLHNYYFITKPQEKLILTHFLMVGTHFWLPKLIFYYFMGLKMFIVLFASCQLPKVETTVLEKVFFYPIEVNNRQK